MAGDPRSEGAMRVATDLVDALDHIELPSGEPAMWALRCQVHYTIGYLLGDDLDEWQARRAARLPVEVRG